MTAPVSQEQLLGDLIPDVYINGITLETSGSPVKTTHTSNTREKSQSRKNQNSLW